MVLEFWCLTVTFLMSVAFHFLLSVLVKAVMMNKKITGERLSPWRNPTDGRAELGWCSIFGKVADDEEVI